MPVVSNPDTKFHELLHAVKNNNGHVLKQLYKDNFKALEQYIVHNNGTADDAKDIYQETFIAVWKNIQLDKFIPENDNSLSAYIFKIGKNKWITQLRSSASKNTLPLQMDALDNAEEDLKEDTNDITLVAENFKKLGDNCRQLLSRFYFKKESMREIAGSFNWTEATAKNNKYRCIEKLRNLLKNQ